MLELSDLFSNNVSLYEVRRYPLSSLLLLKEELFHLTWSRSSIIKSFIRWLLSKVAFVNTGQCFVQPGHLRAAWPPKMIYINGK